MVQRLSLTMRGREPDPVLLEQLTLLAAASMAPTRTAWWRRAAPRSGAVAVAGVLAMTGAAYATQAASSPQRVEASSPLTQVSVRPTPSPSPMASPSTVAPAFGLAGSLPSIQPPRPTPPAAKAKGHTKDKAQGKAKGHTKPRNDGQAKGHDKNQDRHSGKKP